MLAILKAQLLPTAILTMFLAGVLLNISVLESIPVILYWMSTSAILLLALSDDHIAQLAPSATSAMQPASGAIATVFTVVGLTYAGYIYLPIMYAASSAAAYYTVRRIHATVREASTVHQPTPSEI